MKKEVKRKEVGRLIKRELLNEALIGKRHTM